MTVLPYFFFPHYINYNTIIIKGNVKESYQVKSSFSTLLLQISILYIEHKLVWLLDLLDSWTFKSFFYTFLLQ